VSASAQIINFVHSRPTSPEDLLNELRLTEPVLAGRLAFHACARVPRQFNARACATWRRYLYLVPLTLLPGSSTPNAEAVAHLPAMLPVDAEFVDRVFRSLEGLTLPYNAFAVGEDRKTGEGMLDLCTLYRGRAYVVHPDGPAGEPFLCVELVGSRFLRRMVRLLVATAVREALQVPVAERDIDCIQKICIANDRTLRAMPFPGSGLCFSGVGFDMRQLSFWKQQKKRDVEALQAQYAKEDEDAAAETAPTGNGASIVYPCS
jgi:tRNA U38,U39,U40 pseudouridine synthase TruA